jgi:hypothetical protein
MKKSTISTIVLRLQQSDAGAEKGAGTEYGLWSAAHQTWYQVHNMNLVPAEKYERAYKLGYARIHAREKALKLLDMLRNGDKFELS